MLKRLLNIPEDRSFFLFGPRQTGKSTLLAYHFNEANSLVYNLLDLDTFSLLNNNPSAFKEEVQSRKKNITHVIVDEVQKLPVLLDTVHLLMESGNPPCFCLSGSSARKLKREGANLLGGRAWNLSLHPLCYSEFLLNQQEFSLDRALNFGALPSIYLAESDAYRQQDLKAYVDTYLKEEIKEESLVRNVKGFSNFLKFSAQENGNVLNFTNISRDVGVDSKTIKEYFRILEDTLLGFFLMPFASSHRERLVKHPKFYFFDTGVQRALTNKLSLKLEKKTADYGNVFEHFLIKEIINYSNYLNRDYEFFFYRTEAGAEVDLIIKKPDESFLAIEIKATNDPQLKTLKGLSSFRDLVPNSELICVCLSQKPRKLNEILLCPWQEIFERL